MTEKIEKISRPKWVTAKDGIHPSFLPPTDDEVREHANTLGKNLMGQDVIFRDQWLREVESGYANLAQCEELKANGQYGKSEYRERVLRCTKELALALVRLSRFDEAVSLLQKNGRTKRYLAKTLKEVLLYKQAIDVPDDDFCDCPRPTEEIDVTEKHSVTIALNRRTPAIELYSEKHGKVVQVWVCKVCHTANAHGDVPARQATLSDLQSQVEAVAVSALSKGLAPHQVALPVALSDAVLLKATN
jgi:hypothetical protein